MTIRKPTVFTQSVLLFYSAGSVVLFSVIKPGTIKDKYI